MSLLNRLDHFYGNFIRLLSALLTLALLAVAVMALVNWQRATASESERKAQPAPPKVASQDVIRRVIASQTGASLDPISSNDPNHDALERMSKAMIAFGQKHGVSHDDLAQGVDNAMASIRSKISEQDTPALKAAYASGLVETLERTLSDPRIDALLPKADAHPDDSDDVSVTGILGETIEQYDTDFSEQLMMIAGNDDDGTDAHRQREAWTSLARVGGPLLLLILVLQLLTFGRIEQNTRALDSTK